MNRGWGERWRRLDKCIGSWEISWRSSWRRRIGVILIIRRGYWIIRSIVGRR